MEVFEALTVEARAKGTTAEADSVEKGRCTRRLGATGGALISSASVVLATAADAVSGGKFDDQRGPSLLVSDRAQRRDKGAFKNLTAWGHANNARSRFSLLRSFFGWIFSALCPPLAWSTQSATGAGGLFHRSRRARSSFFRLLMRPSGECSGADEMCTSA